MVQKVLLTFICCISTTTLGAPLSEANNTSAIVLVADNTTISPENNTSISIEDSTTLSSQDHVRGFETTINGVGDTTLSQGGHESEENFIPVNMGYVMEKLEVVPDLIDVAPTKNVEILYPNGIQVKAGNELTPTEATDRPFVTWKADPTVYYTLVYIDPDSPNRESPMFESILHWMIVNIPGNHLEQGETFCDYVGALAPPLGGYHRNIFLLFQQKNHQIFTEPHILYNNYSERKLFSLSKFIQKYNLGDPVAGNIFLAKFDRQVPITRQKFTE